MFDLTLNDGAPIGGSAIAASSIGGSSIGVSSIGVSSIPGGMTGLTARQRDVLRLLAEGRSTKDIARCLSLGVGTVKVHLAGAYRALGARNRVEAVVKASRIAR